MGLMPQADFPNRSPATSLGRAYTLRGNVHAPRFSSPMTLITRPVEFGASATRVHCPLLMLREHCSVRFWALRLIPSKRSCFEIVLFVEILALPSLSAPAKQFITTTAEAFSRP